MRLTFGITALEGGFNSLPVILGMFAVSQVVADALNIEANASAIKATMRGMFMSLRDYVVHGWNMLRSSLIGIWIGILPGVGATVASIVAYTTAKNLSRKPEEFGTGSEEAIVAAESANNATTGGTLIPILTLGISGGLTDSILLGALVIHNLQPGPLLFKNNPEIVNTIFATHLVAHLAMFALMTFGIAFFARLMQVPRAFILPMVIVFSVLGAFGLNNRAFDIWVMLGFGLLGVLLELAKVPLAPFVVGLVLAPVAESELRSGLMASAGSFMPLIERPVACTMLVLSAGLFVWPFVRAWRKRRPGGGQPRPGMNSCKPGRITMTKITRRQALTLAAAAGAAPLGLDRAWGGLSGKAGAHDHPDRAGRADRRRGAAPAADDRQEEAAAAADRRRSTTPPRAARPAPARSRIRRPTATPSACSTWGC